MANKVDSMSNTELQKKLAEYGHGVLPITDSTRKLLIRKLKTAMESEINPGSSTKAAAQKKSGATTRKRKAHEKETKEANNLIEQEAPKQNISLHDESANISTSPSKARRLASTPIKHNSNSSDIVLDDSILSLLGDAPKDNVELGPPIHKDIAIRWHDTLSSGLQEDIKWDLLKLYRIPNNLEKLIPPILNPEIKDILSVNLVNQDNALQQKQNQIGITLSALGTSLNMLILNKKVDSTVLIKSLSDAGRLLCDMFFDETKTRRSNIIRSTKQQIKDMLVETTPDKYLFGEHLSFI